MRDAEPPDNLRTKGWDNVPLLKMMLSSWLHGLKYGAYPNLWCGVSEEVTIEDGGRYGIPWARWHSDPRADILGSLKGKEDGGTGVAGEFWGWCERETATYATF